MRHGLNFVDKEITSDEPKEFALKVLDFMRDKIMKFQKKTGNMCNLEVTPAEGISFRLTRKN
jgi:ribonucleoside-triphosphate reductase